jgi:CBS domain-containing protein
MSRKIVAEVTRAFPRGGLWLGGGAVAVDASVPVSSYMSREVPYLRADMWIDAAASHLRAHGLDEVAVLDGDGRPVGCVSLADLSAEAAESEPANDGEDAGFGFELRARGLGSGFHLREGTGRLRVRDVMLPYVPVILASSSLAEAAGTMLDNDLESLVVVSDDGTVNGRIGARDITRWLAEQTRQDDFDRVPELLDKPGTRLRDVMRPVVSVRREDSLLGARALLWGNDLHELPVTEGGHVIGVVTEADIDDVLAAHCDEDGWVQDLLVDDVMKAPPLVAGPDDPLGAVSHILGSDDHACVLIERQGRLLGIVTGKDLEGGPRRHHHRSS